MTSSQATRLPLQRVHRRSFGFARPCARAITWRVRGLRCVCSILLMMTAAVLFLLDACGCARHRLPGGLSKLKPCWLAGIDEELFCGKLTVFENRETRTGRTIDLNVVVLPALRSERRKRSRCSISRAARAHRPLMQQDSMPGPAKYIASNTTSCASTSAALGNQIALRFPARKRRSIT